MIQTLDSIDRLYLIANGYNYDGTFSGNKIAKSISSTSKWEFSSVIGAVGNTDYSSKRNATGFTALPGGERSTSDTFVGLGGNGGWWSISEFAGTMAVSQILGNHSVKFDSDYFSKAIGRSVRYVRD